MKLFASIIPVIVIGSSVAQAAPLHLGEGVGTKVEKVQQYENLMPTIVLPGQPRPNTTITLVSFQMEGCRTFSESDFEVKADTRDGVQLLQVAPKYGLIDCMGPTRTQRFVLSSDLFTSQPIVVVNPVAVERLPNAY